MSNEVEQENEDRGRIFAARTASDAGAAGLRQQGEQPGDPPTVSFKDAKGVVWTVREVPVPYAGGEAREMSLVFECAVAVRRVRHYPPEWRTLSEEQLAALSWGT